MIKGYLTIALRALRRDKGHALVNIGGLGLGIAVCFLIALFVRDEWTFDQFHSNASRIYRVFARENWGENQQFFNTVTPFPMGPALKENFPEVEAQVRFNNLTTQLKVGDHQFTEPISVGGRDFFSVFDFEFLQGDKDNVLNKLSDVVLTEAAAQKYFGRTDILGRPLSIQLGEAFEEFVVSAVIKDLPPNSSIQFSTLISDLNYSRLYPQQVLTSGWFNINPETYVLLHEGIDAHALETKFPAVFRSLLGEDNFMKSKYQAGLQPLTSIHLDTSYPVGVVQISNPMYSYVLSGMAGLILVVACINFITLSIGRSVKRAREVGIRKVMGAYRSQLMVQFVGEALLMTVASVVLAFLLAQVSLTTFNDLAGKQLVLHMDGFLILTAILMVVLIGILAGSYPAFVLSNFKPIATLKGKVLISGKQSLRKVLVGFQLVLSIFLVASSLIMSQQLNFLQQKDLGFHREQVMVIPLQVPRGGGLAGRVNKGFDMAEQFKAAFSPLPSVVSVCAASHDFGNGNWTNIGYTDDGGTYRTFNMVVTDDNYLVTLGMQMSAGRNFSALNASDHRRAMMVNEAFAKEQGWSDAVGKRIPGKAFADHEIIGVVKDFNYASLYTKVNPLVIVMDASIVMSGSENINIDNSPVPKLMVRLKPDQVAAGIEQVKAAWEKVGGAQAFNFSFMDQSIDAQYRSDRNLGKIVNLATMLAVLIGSLGLYGLAALSMQNRTKEVSIRKVMGATEQSLLVLLSKEYVVLVSIAFLISAPITWYGMRKWLESFQYRISLGWEVFLWAGAISLVVALATISARVLKIAWTRPADNLRSE